MKAWRICNKNYASDAFSGEGAYQYGGRWNSAGVRVVYLGGTPSISVLEALVHVSNLTAIGALENVLIPVEFDDALIADAGTLPPDWDAFPAPFSTAAIGDQWIASRPSLMLKVPSAVLSLENNYLLNPAHPDINKVVIGVPVPINIDIRLKKLYSGPIP